MKLEVGQRASYKRTFYAKDVKAFAELSGDKGVHHTQPDREGRTMVHGLLTATIPTKLGGDMNYIARKMVFQFIRPVFVGDTITCEAVITKVEPGEAQQKVTIGMVCRNQHGKEVLLGETQGIIRL